MEYLVHKYETPMSEAGNQAEGVKCVSATRAHWVSPMVICLDVGDTENGQQLVGQENTEGTMAVGSEFIS